MAEAAVSLPADHEPAQHTSEDGPGKGWNAADVKPEELSDDDYAAQFEVITDGRPDAR